jgi:hypothetical protein
MNLPAEAVLTFSRKTEPVACANIQREKFILKNWLTQLWGRKIKNLCSEPAKWSAGGS